MLVSPDWMHLLIGITGSMISVCNNDYKIGHSTYQELFQEDQPLEADIWHEPIILMDTVKCEYLVDDVFLLVSDYIG